MVWNVVLVYKQIINLARLSYTNPKPNISELMLEVMTESCVLCHGSVAELDVLSKKAKYSHMKCMILFKP